MRRARRQLALVAAFIAIMALIGSALRVTVVQGESMLPAYKDGQILLVNRLAYLSGGPRRGEVVLFQRANDILIKRVAYLPGDMIDRKAAQSFRTVVDYFDKPAKRTADGLVVPKGVVVVLGDNPANSDDSRAFGPVPLGDLLGRVIGAPPKQ